MLRVSDVVLPLDAGLPGAYARALVRRAAAQALGVSEGDVREVRLLRRSVDARKKRDVHFVATLGVELADEGAEKRALEVSSGLSATKRGGASRAKVALYTPPEPPSVPALGKAFAASGEPRPVVVGTGPAGLFCALYLARAGLRPLVLERGSSVDERRVAVAAFEAGGPLDVQTNIPFGEGGAGTFSDGKLTTNIKSPFARQVLQWFVDAGAPEEVLWQAKPHIGTDRLVEVVRTLRSQIIEAGGEVRFNVQLVGLRVEKDGETLAGIDVRDGRTGEIARIEARRVVLACGHSARDTFALLHAAQVTLEQKPFSVGVRIEHAQAAIDRAQYGNAAAHPALGAADYKLAVHLDAIDGAGTGAQHAARSVYTFCMCPGGEVVCAASESGGVVVNGMSRFARDGINANSALLVDVAPRDFGCEHPLAGVEFQRRIERAAFAAAEAAGGGPYVAPAQTVGDFLAEHAGRGARDVLRAAKAEYVAHKRTSERAKGVGARGSARTSGAIVQPTYARGVAWCSLRECLPSFVCDALAEALPLFDAKLQGFADPAAVLTGVETRSSSPVRIVRDEQLQALFRPAPERAASHEGNASACTSAPCDVREDAPKHAAARGSGLYPCGEGAGYAGGIMSAACDGLRVAEALAHHIAG